LMKKVPKMNNVMRNILWRPPHCPGFALAL
jgi:hypothetical protein